MIGQRIGGFEVTGEIGRGGMGVVYRARQISLEREVALKTLLPGLDLDETLVTRFGAEARAASRINHPNLVQVYDVGTEGGVHYLAMELVEGESLAEVLQREGPVDFVRAAALASQVAGGLGALHRAGIVHRDMKPSNILVRPDSVIKITDFGVARLQGSATRLRTAGHTVGTADYMSPEQARGEELDGRSDIYSLGVILYQILAGEAPFRGDTALVVMKKHCDQQPPSIRRARPDMPDRLVEIVSRCLAKGPEERYHTAEALSADLDHLRLELEFAALSAETPAGGTPSLYSTRTVLGLQREAEAGKAAPVRLWGCLRGVVSSAVSYATGALDRETVALRRSAGKMEEALEALAEAKNRRAKLRQTAADLRARAERARQQSGKAFDADDIAQVDEFAELEKGCNEEALDFESAAEGLTDNIQKLEALYKTARAEHERLRAKADLKQARAIQESSARGLARRRRWTRAVAAMAVVALAGTALYWTLIRPNREEQTPAHVQPPRRLKCEVVVMHDGPYNVFVNGVMLTKEKHRGTLTGETELADGDVIAVRSSGSAEGVQREGILFVARSLDGAWVATSNAGWRWSPKETDGWLEATSSPADWKRVGRPTRSEQSQYQDMADLYPGATIVKGFGHPAHYWGLVRWQLVAPADTAARPVRIVAEVSAQWYGLAISDDVELLRVLDGPWPIGPSGSGWETTVSGPEGSVTGNFPEAFKRCAVLRVDTPLYGTSKLECETTLLLKPRSGQDTVRLLVGWDRGRSARTRVYNSQGTLVLDHLSSGSHYADWKEEPVEIAVGDLLPVLPSATVSVSLPSAE